MDSDTLPRDLYESLRVAELRPFEQVEKEERKAYREAADAERALRAPLTRWPMVTEAQYAVYTGDANMLRGKRIRELAGQGKRILDIGAGRGLIGGTLLRDCSPASYAAIDLSDDVRESFEQMLQVNDFPHTAEVHLESKDLYTLDADWVGQFSPDIAFCFEVLEHVPDAEAALAAIAASLPTGCLFAFSVPMYGRLEDVFGHWSIFDADRVDAMVRAAGLEAVSAEPLANRWSLVVTRKVDTPPGPPPAATPGVRAAPDPSIHRADPKTYRSLGASPSEIVGPWVSVAIPGGSPGSASRRGLAERLRGVARFGKKESPSQASTGGLTIPVSGSFARMRLKLLGADGESLPPQDTNIEVRAMSGDVCVARWVCYAAKRPLGVPHRLVLRRGTARFPFQVKGNQDLETPADRLELVVTLPAGVSAELSVVDVGWAWR